MSDKPSYFSILTAAVRYDKSLCANAKLLFSEITALTQAEGYCWASNKYFAELYDVDVSTIKRWISDLEKSGHIELDTQKIGMKWNRKIYVKNVYEGSKISPSKAQKEALRGLKNKPIITNKVIAKEEGERASSSKSKKPEKEDKSFFERLNNTNFLLINMNSEDRHLLAKRGSKLTAKEWDNVCLRFIQRSKVIDINPVVPYFQTLINEKAEPKEEDYRKEAERKLLEKQDDIQEKTLQVKMLKDTYEVPNFWNPEAGHLIEMRISPMFFEYKFRDMKQHSRVLYEDANFYIKLSEIKKLIELLTY